MKTLEDETQEMPLGESCPGCGSEITIARSADASLVEIRCGCASVHALA